MNSRQLAFGMLIFLTALFSGIGCRSKDGSSIPTNIIIVLVDALRWDHLGVYGYERNTSPAMDQFASEGLVFETAISQSGWTAPAVMGLFSSDYPKHTLNDSRTFAQWLSEHGYQTAAFTANPIMIETMGYDRGFQTYELLAWQDAAALSEISLAWINNRNVLKPFCLYIHFMDVHDPYRPPPPYDSMFGEEYEGRIDGDIRPFKALWSEKKPMGLTERERQRLQDLYDGGIAYLDFHFGGFLEGLKKAGVYEESVIVVVSDHGDEFMEHGGIGHGHSVFEELIHVPLIIGGPQIKKGRYDHLFELIDLAPTLMDMLNIPFDYEVAGQSFVKALIRNLPLKGMAFSEIYRTSGYNAGSWAVSVRKDSAKLIYFPHDKRYALYDLSTESIEGEELQTDMTGSIRTLALTLQEWREAFSLQRIREDRIDKEYLEALRSLGYVR